MFDGQSITCLRPTGQDTCKESLRQKEKGLLQQSSEFGLINGEHFHDHTFLVKIMEGKAAVFVFALAALVVIGVGPQVGFRRIKVQLEFGIGGHTEGLQIAEIEIPAVFGAVSVGAAPKGAVTVQPAIGRDVEHGPVVVADAGRIDIRARLPLGWDARAAAQGNEQQGLNAAVALEPGGHVVRYVGDGQVLTHVGVVHPGGDKVINFAGLDERVGFAASQLFAQGADIR